MSQKYALPCPCGATLAVAARQAGETTVCEACGNPRDIPTLRELKDLGLVEAEPAVGPRRNWSGLHGGLFVVGTLCCVIAAGALGYTYWLRSQFQVERPNLEQIQFRHDLSEIPLTSSWELWKDYKKKRLETRPTPYHVLAKNKVRQLDRWLQGFGVLGGLGVACVLGSVVLFGMGKRG